MLVRFCVCFVFVLGMFCVCCWCVVVWALGRFWIGSRPILGRLLVCGGSAWCMFWICFKYVLGMLLVCGG